MSYCRWSSMNWMCDLYCYEDVNGGWTTHVASSRRMREPRPNDDRTMMLMAKGRISPEQFGKRHEMTMADLERIPLEPIGLPYDGEEFNDATLEAFHSRLHMLRKAGYRFPDYVLEDVAEEMLAE